MLSSRPPTPPAFQHTNCYSLAKITVAAVYWLHLRHYQNEPNTTTQSYLPYKLQLILSTASVRPRRLSDNLSAKKNKRKEWIACLAIITSITYSCLDNPSSHSCHPMTRCVDIIIRWDSGRHSARCRLEVVARRAGVADRRPVAPSVQDVAITG